MAFGYCSLLRLLGFLVVGRFTFATGAFLLGGVLGILILGLCRHSGALLGDGEGVQFSHFVGVL